MAAVATTAAEEGAWRLSLPLTLFFILFFAAPLICMAALSLLSEADLGFVGLKQYVRFFTDSLSRESLVDTLVLGLKVTLVCLVLGFPLAWAHARGPAWLKPVILFVIVLPLLTSVVVRTFAWIVILGRQGIVNNLIVELGLAAAPLRLLYTENAVVIALAQIQMPLMVLPLMTSFAQLDPRLEEASQSLGAGAWRTFLRVLLPLTLPGIVAGSMLVYAAAVTAFVTQTLVGGGRLIYMPLLIYQQAISLNNWPFSAAVSIVLLVTVLAVVAMFNALGRASRGYAGG
jgi:putative spermidine/putrescine transport system permease protein